MVAFDLDDTLAESKSPLSPEMARTLADLLAVSAVCIISGGQFQQFDTQVLAQLPTDANLGDLHLMPTCGTRYLRFYEGLWHEVYAHVLSQVQKQAAIDALETSAKQLGLWEPDEKVTGPRIEDRGSQITYSALGQAARVDDKKAWDPDGTKRERLRTAVAVELPDLEVRAGGSTSIDVTRRGIDKAYGMNSLARQTGIPLTEMLFVGDRLMPGGNDYPVKELGVPCHAVSGPDDTEHYVRGLIEQLSAKGD
ncbi:HAD-IIB family hydrolase [Propionimicrobium sp. PCR01-08-3]|uniref:HAD-IIB family hydrolase n=1 Tax=Propionimicrobium sp. PCR01-08-3 TaxID=3052086 RepID=UPI00255CB36D|nr:HAD-IIB family hydrolase [Propionimicrobium sp. PCR01-08-3]WIY84168.1 HAD-IIB family hydrolase [Propionimicrobium sp. PCR01-08-3]